jgi:hypothetical protein
MGQQRSIPFNQTTQDLTAIKIVVRQTFFTCNRSKGILFTFYFVLVVLVVLVRIDVSQSIAF